MSEIILAIPASKVYNLVTGKQGETMENVAEVAAQALADLVNTEGLVTDSEDRRRIHEALGVIDDKYVPLYDVYMTTKGAK